MERKNLSPHYLSVKLEGRFSLNKTRNLLVKVATVIEEPSLMVRSIKLSYKIYKFRRIIRQRFILYKRRSDLLLNV